MKERALLFIFCLASLVCTSAYAISPEKRRALFSDNPEMAACQLVLYRCDTLTPLTAAPDGYKAFYIHHYGRHGSRYNTKQNGRIMDALDSMMMKASAAGDLTPIGDSLAASLHKVILQCTGRYDMLTPRGADQHQGIARRMYARFPEVFAGNRNVNVQTSVVPRCIVCMAAFTGSLLKCDGTLILRYDCGARLQDSINVSLPEAHCDSVDKASTAGIERDIPAATVAAMYFKPDKMEEYVKNLNKFFKGVYESAAISQNLSVPANVFKWVPEEEIYFRWQVKNRSLYLHNCNSATEFGPSSTERVSKIARRIVNAVDDALKKKDRAADLCFGHDFPLLSLLNIFNVDFVPQQLALKDINNCFDAADYISMASNIQMIFYSNGTDDVLVKLLHNEKEHKLKGIKAVCGPYYRWADVREMVMKKICPTTDRQ